MTTTKTTRIFAFEIEYDTDGISVEFLRNEGCNLPSELWVEVEAGEINEDNSHEIADAISDCTGWCVNTFQFKAFAN